MYHLLRADEFSADEALRIGLVQEVIEPGRQRDRAVELGRELSQCAPVALQHTIANAPTRARCGRAHRDRRHSRDEQGGDGDGRLPRRDRVVHRTTPGTVHGTLT